MDLVLSSQVVVLGPPRSGTSAVAGVLIILGVNMGVVNQSNHEDPRMNYNRNTLKNIKEVVANRSESESGSIWGWKEPTTHRYIEKVYKMMGNPKIIISSRSPVKCAESKLKRNPATPDDYETDLSLSLAISKMYADIFGVVKKIGLPYLIIDSDELIKKPEETSVNIASFLGLKIDKYKIEMINDFLAPGGYKSIPSELGKF